MTALGAAQAALAATVLCGALALVASLAREHDALAALDGDDVLAFDVDLPAAGYPEASQIEAFDDRALAGLAALPGVESAALVKALAPRQPWGFHPGLAGVPDADSPALGWQVVTPDYFRALRVAVLAGRTLADGDRPGSERAVVLNRSAARRLAALGGEGRGVGGALRFNGESYRIVGVVEDGPEAPPGHDDGATVFLALAQRPVPPGYLRDVSFVLRAAPGARVAETAVRDAIRRLDGELPVSHLESLGGRLRSSIAFSQIRLNAALGASFGLLALVFVVASLSAALVMLVQERRREIAVRIALGASPRRVATDVLLYALSMVAAGGAAGLLLARATAPLLAARVAGFGGGEGRQAILVGVILVATALGAALLPALRAGRTDPAEMLARE